MYKRNFNLFFVVTKLIKKNENLRELPIMHFHCHFILIRVLDQTQTLCANVDMLNWRRTWFMKTKIRIKSRFTSETLNRGTWIRIPVPVASSNRCKVAWKWEDIRKGHGVRYFSSSSFGRWKCWVIYFVKLVLRILPGSHKLSSLGHSVGSICR